MSHISLSNYRYDFPDVSAVFGNRNRIYDSELPFNIKIGEIKLQDDKLVSLTTNPDGRTCNILYSNATEKMTAFSKCRILCEKSKDFSIEENFQKKLFEVTTNIFSVLRIGTVKKISFQDIKLFSKFDSCNSPQRKASNNIDCILELKTLWTGTGLQIQGENYTQEIPNFHMYIFDQNISYKIVKNDGNFYRVFLTFQISTIPFEPFPELFQSIVEKMKNKGVKRFGFFTAFSYEDFNLESADLVIKNVFQPFCEKIDIIKVKYAEKIGWIQEDVYRFVEEFKANGMHKEMWYTLNDKSTDFSEEKEEWVNKAPEWVKCVDEKFRLGDVLVLNSPFEDFIRNGEKYFSVEHTFVIFEIS